MNKKIPLILNILIILTLFFYLSQYFFTLTIPLIVYTPLVGLIGLILSFRVKNKYKIGYILLFILLTLGIPIYLALSWFFPGILV